MIRYPALFNVTAIALESSQRRKASTGQPGWTSAKALLTLRKKSDKDPGGSGRLARQFSRARKSSTVPGQLDAI